MTINMELVKKGRNVPLRGILDQAAYHRALEAKHRAALYAAGWTPKLSGEFYDKCEELERQIGATLEARSDSREYRKDEQAAIDEAKALKRKLVSAFVILHEDGLVRDDDRKIIEESGSLRRSTPLILEYLTVIRDKVSIFDSDLRPYFGGASAFSILERIKGDLAKAQGLQETSLKALPQETLKIHELKGRTLQLIERINHIGKIAFDGQAAILAEFNKDLILRARRKQRAISTIEAVGGEGQGEDETA